MWECRRAWAFPLIIFLLHPVSTALFIYTLLLSMFHALWNDGIIWREQGIRWMS